LNDNGATSLTSRKQDKTKGVEVRLTSWRCSYGWNSSLAMEVTRAWACSERSFCFALGLLSSPKGTAKLNDCHSAETLRLWMGPGSPSGPPGGGNTPRALGRAWVGSGERRRCNEAKHSGAPVSFIFILPKV